MMLTGRKLRFSQSIAIQVLIPMLVIGLLALSSMLVSLLVTLNTQHDAEAINIAGSMRMQTYRIAVHLQQAVAGEADPIDLIDTLADEHRTFSEKLYQSSIARVAGEHSDISLNRAYQRVVTNWEQHMAPLLLSLGSAEQGSLAAASREYLGHVEEHVGDIDRLVLSI